MKEDVKKEKIMKIVLASDHAGFALKKNLVQWLQNCGYEITDLGPFSEDSVDYPDYGHLLATEIEKANAEAGILMCGSGNGVCMTANKHANVRAALAWKPEIAALARQHNNANVLCLPARFLTESEAKDIVAAYLNSTFEGGRHEKRVDKIEK